MSKSTLFLRAAVIALGLGVLAICTIGLPALIFFDRTGYYRPILISMYVTVVPFFIALYQTLKLLSYIDANKAFSGASIKALKIIAYCATIVGVLYALGLPYIYYVADLDDAPGVMAIGLIITGASFVVATFAAVCKKLVQSAKDIQTENDLTV